MFDVVILGIGFYLKKLSPSLSQYFCVSRDDSPALFFVF